MNKEIEFGGLEAQTPEYGCRDGGLAAALNLVPEDGALRRVTPPLPLMKCQDSDSVALVHHTAQGDNYIITRKNDHLVNIAWISASGDNARKYLHSRDATLLEEFAASEIRDVAAVGNIVTVATRTGLRYLFWRDNAYTVLDEHPPMPAIDFALRREVELVKEWKPKLKLVKTKKAGNDDDEFSFDANSQANIDELFGPFLKGIKDDVYSKGRFYQPFFVRYALRMYDGTHIMHSAPVLMLPWIHMPWIYAPAGQTLADRNYDEGPSGAKEYFSKMLWRYFQTACGLYYRVQGAGAIAELRKKWDGLVMGIDIFITPQIQTWQSPTETIAYGEPGEGPLTPFRTLISDNDWDTKVTALADNENRECRRLFVGQYSDGEGHFYFDRTYNFAHEFKPYKLTPSDSALEALKSCSQGRFYKVASIDLSELEEMDELKRMDIPSTSGDALAVLPRLKDDWRSRHTFTGSCLHAYNSRINIGCVQLTPPAPLAIGDTQPYRTNGNAANDHLNKTNVGVSVYTRMNGRTCVAKLGGSASVWDMRKAFPRYIFYPDPSAYKMVFTWTENGEAVSRSVNLTQHDYLNGAYFLGSFSLDASEAGVDLEISDVEKTAATSVEFPNTIYTSEANDPMVYTAEGVNAVGAGRVRGMASATAALSQGQFGQYPLYAFTSEGIWALQVNNTGLFTAASPVTRDVCTNGAAITMLDSAVAFPSERGLMILQGATCKCASEGMGVVSPFDVRTLPGFDELATLAGADIAWFYQPSFPDVLATASMVYDYARQRLIMGSRNHPYAYVLSLKTMMWGMCDNYIDTAVNAYPGALAMSPDGHLVDFSRASWLWTRQFEEAPYTRFNQDVQPGVPLYVLMESSWPEADCLALTRPLSMDMPDVLKTINTVMLRGDIREEETGLTLWGSRDLLNWHLVRACRGLYMRRFRGTPYKYFRLAVKAHLAEGESMSRISLDYDPRLTNRLR